MSALELNARQLDAETPVLPNTCGSPVKSSQEFLKFLVMFQPFINPEKKDAKKNLWIYSGKNFGI